MLNPGYVAGILARALETARSHADPTVRARVHALGGRILLLGVQHSESTVLHVAEALAGVPYSVTHPCWGWCRRWTSRRRITAIAASSG